MGLKKITQLPLDTEVVSTDVMPVVSDGATKRVTLQTLAGFFGANLPGTVVYTTDPRLSDARTPTSHTHTASQITDFTSAVAAVSPPASWSTLTGKPSTFPSTIAEVSGLQTALDGKATPADVSTAVAGLVASAPATLDTLNELAAALGNDASFATTVTNALAAKAPLASPTFTGTVSGVTATMVGLGNVPNVDATARANHTGTQAWSTIVSTPTTLAGYGITDGVTTSDSRLTDSREWTASTVTQEEAEAGTATTRRAWTAQRVRQAVAAWWGTVTNPLFETVGVSGNQAYFVDSGNGMAVYGNVGDDATQLFAMSSFGLTFPNGTTQTTAFVAANYAAASHSHGQITNAGAIGSTSGLPIITTTSGVLTVGAFGTSAGQFCQGNDSRLSDTRTPTDGSVTDAKITSGGLSASSINWVAIAPWAPSTAYAKGDLVSNAGIAYRRSAAGTSGSTFNTANWQQITPSEFVGSQITSGTVAVARLGSGSPSSANFLRGDGTWAAAGSSSASDLTSGTLSLPRLPARVRAAVNVYNWSSFR